MDVNRAFSAPFQDQKWATKAALGGLWMLLVVTSPALYGYALDYIRNVTNGRDIPLPEWSDFGRLWIRGFLLNLAIFIYMLPALILLAVALIPIIGAAASGAGEEAVGITAAGSLCLFGLLATMWAIAVSIFVFAAMVNYSLRESFGSLFAFGEMSQRIKTGPGYFKAWGYSLLIFFAAGAISGTITGVLGALGPLAILGNFVTGFVTFIAIVMSGHLFGQWAVGAYSLTPPSQPEEHRTPPPAAPAPPDIPSPPSEPFQQGEEGRPAAPPVPPPPPPTDQTSPPLPRGDEGQRHEASPDR